MTLAGVAEQLHTVFEYIIRYGKKSSTWIYSGCIIAGDYREMGWGSVLIAIAVAITMTDIIVAWLEVFICLIGWHRVLRGSWCFYK
jgi:hypothetical protein